MPGGTRRTRLIWGGALVLVVLLFTFMLRPRPVEVDTAVIERAPLRATVSAEARSRVRDLFVITAPVAGRVDRINLDPGDTVPLGSVVANLAPLPIDAVAEQQARARLGSAQSLLRDSRAREEQAKSSLAQARRALERARALEAAGGLSRQGREEAELSAQLAQEEVYGASARTGAAEAEVRAASAALLAVDGASRGSARIAVRAPAAGRVLRVPDQSARVVAAGAPLLEVGNAANLEIVIDVLSTDAVRIPPRARVDLDGWGGDSTLHARVRLVEPSATTRISALGVEEQRVNVIADLLAHAPALGDGFRLDAQVVVWESEDVLVAPASALFRSGDEWRVFVVQNGRAMITAVQIGHRSETAVEIMSGIPEGARVILFPSDRITDGVRVTMR